MLEDPHRSRRFWLIAAVAAVSLVLVGFWAGRVVLVPPADPLAESEVVAFEVIEGSLGRSVELTAIGSWERTPLANAVVGGTVTSVDVESGDLVDVGDVVLTVDLRPSVVAEGTVPAFRDLTVGSVGEDVAQLETFLADSGFPIGDGDGVFDEALAEGVRAWQATLGVAPDGMVWLGDMLFVTDLPSRVAVDSAAVVGTLLAPGQPLLSQLSDQPVFWVPLTLDQRSFASLGSNVVINHGSGEWRAVVEAVIERPDQARIELRLAPVEGSSLCGDECASQVSFDDRSLFPARLEVVPEVTGPMVPIAALATDPTGAVTVRTVDGDELEVEVVASTEGRAIVDGVPLGTLVVLTGGDGP